MARLPRGEGNRRYDHQFQLRMPKRLFDRVKAAATATEQAVNSKIVSVLAKEFPEPTEPETVNEALLSAAREILSDWSHSLEALGHDPKSNKRLTALSDAIANAEDAA
ncbi:Arc family DNA-binding protein [Brucella intermedia]|uniref:Arc family DNA-binding protein n=1 Tax=Brucella intermedia TaxID=94625 RepID=UPI003AB11559